MQAHSIRHGLLVACAVALAVGCGTEPPPLQDPAPKNWDDHTQGLPFVIGYEQGLERAQTEGKPAMMFVTTTWCGFCTKLAKESFNDPEVRGLLSKFVCVIVDGDEETDARTTLGADQGYPHVFFLAADGRNVGECLGYRPVDQFKPIVEQSLAAARGG